MQTQNAKQTVKIRKTPVARTAGAGPVIWALDPLRTDSRSVLKLLKVIELWRKVMPSALVPASVLSAFELGWPADALFPVEEEIVGAVDRSLARFAAKLKLRESPRLLVHQTPFEGSAVQNLIKCASKEKASLIAVNTSGRKGFRRLGSFTERLIASSPFAVLAVNPRSHVPRKISRVLVATNFASGTDHLMERAITVASAARAKLTIFFHSESYFTHFTTDGGADAAILAAYQDLENERREKGDRWADEARRRGVDAEFVASKKLGPTSDAVLALARRQKADLIVTATRHGRLGHLVLGSTAREILARATQPVLVEPILSH